MRVIVYWRYGKMGRFLVIERRTPEIGYILIMNLAAQKLTYVWMKDDLN